MVLKLEIRFFKVARGDEPVAAYLKNLPANNRVRIEGCLFVLGATGRLDMPHGRKISGQRNLFEIRSGRHRIFYAFHEGEVVLLSAFMKKSQRTPKEEIDLALKRFCSYINLGAIK